VRLQPVLVTILPYCKIRQLATEKHMIDPFSEGCSKDEQGRPVISYGLSSFGYDLRAADEWKIFTNVMSAVVDPKDFDERSFVSLQRDHVLIPPNSFVLARSLEYIRIPDNIMVIALGKSTFARCGVVANVTPLEPGWEGHVTLEFSNTTPLPAKMYANEGCVQLLFFEGERPEMTYADRKGKYQGQRGITLPRL